MRHREQRELLLYLVLAASAACVVAAQKTGVELPHFDVASIKAESPDIPHTMGVHVFPGGRLQIQGFSLKELIITAFDLSFWQVSGGDAWVSKNIYFVEATPPDALRSSIKSIRYTLFGIDEPLLRQMLQALLIDRFQLKFHRKSTSGDVYLLERSERPLALNPAKIPAGATESKAFGEISYVGGDWYLFATTMPQLARFGSRILYAPVFDRTGLAGSFDLRQPQPDLEPQYDGDQTSSFKAFLAAAGLRWERSKGPIEIFVIDHAAAPSPN